MSELIVDWHELDIALCQMCDFMPIVDVIDRFESGGQLTQFQWRFAEDVRIFYFHAEDVVKRALALGPGLMRFGGSGSLFSMAGYVRLNDEMLTSAPGPIAELIGDEVLLEGKSSKREEDRRILERILQSLLLYELDSIVPTPYWRWAAWQPGVSRQIIEAILRFYDLSYTDIDWERSPSRAIAWPRNM